MDQQGLFVTSDANSYKTNAQLKRYVINSRIDIDVNKNFNMGLQLFGRLQDGTQPGAATATILQGLLTTPNNAYSIRNPDGSFGGTSNYTQNLLAQTIASGYMADHVHDVMVNLDLSYKLDELGQGLVGKSKRQCIGTGREQPGPQQNRPPFFRNPFRQQAISAYHRYGSTVNQQNNFTNTTWARYRFVQLSTGYNQAVRQIMR